MEIGLPEKTDRGETMGEKKTTGKKTTAKRVTKKEKQQQEARQQLALKIIERLKQEYPDAECSLDYNEAWKLLVSVRLAAQCTDARVNIVVQDLYAKYPTVEALAEATVEEIEAIVKPCGLGHSKARDIQACMTILPHHQHYQIQSK